MLATGQGTHVHLAWLRLAAWHRGWNFLKNNQKISKKPAIAEAIAGFLLEKTTPARAGRHKQNKRTKDEYENKL
jgi:hypothetical protein